MILYRITNNINHKKYIGITNNTKKRWANHCCNKTMAIGKAIQKYGKENFSFEILKSGLSIEEAEKLEIQTIKDEHSLISENGYNSAYGGMYGIKYDGQQQGEKNPNHILTEEEVKYIKNHRDVPQYVLFDEFSDKITYNYFKSIYSDRVWKHIKPTVNEYPYNLQFSCQFTNSLYTYEEVVEARKLYQKGIPMGEAYKMFNEKGSYTNFSYLYNGKTFSLVMPEVFSEENHSVTISNAHSGEHNGRAKLTAQDVKIIRERAKTEDANTILKDYPPVSITAIRNVINHKTWKNI